MNRNELIEEFMQDIFGRGKQMDVLKHFSNDVSATKFEISTIEKLNTLVDKIMLQ